MSTLNRQELYEQVWTTPTVQLAKKYGISDVAIAKICRRHRIPKPPLGLLGPRAARAEGKPQAAAGYRGSGTGGCKDIGTESVGGASRRELGTGPHSRVRAGGGEPDRGSGAACRPSHPGFKDGTQRRKRQARREGTGPAEGQRLPRPGGLKVEHSPFDANP